MIGYSLTLPDVGRIKKNYDNNNHYTRLRYCVGSIVLQLVSTGNWAGDLGGFPALIVEQSKTNKLCEQFYSALSLGRVSHLPLRYLG